MKTVLITGASRGIGKATAQEFSKNGWHVVICYNKSKIEAELLSKEIGATVVQADVSKAEEVKKMHETLLSSGIHIDCLVNNAGIAKDILFTDITEDEWDRMFAVNVKGAFLVTKEFLSDMFGKENKSIINVSSIWGETGAAMEVHYSASKAALIGMTKALAKELAPSKIRVNAVTPGYVDTDMNSCYSKEDVEMIKDEIPLGKIASPADIAKTIGFLASDSASYITGQVLGVNGGWYV